MKSILVLLLLAGTAAADIKVHQSGGVTSDPDGAPAVVTFAADEKVTVRQVTSESQAFVTASNGVNATGYADTSKVLCATPCKLEMPPGPMRIRFGDYNPMNANKPIDFNFRAGDNAYRIKPFNGGKFVTGFLLAIIGGSALITCGTLGIVIEDNRTPMLALAAVGGGVLIGGAVMIGNSRASAESVPIHDRRDRVPHPPIR